MKKYLTIIALSLLTISGMAQTKKWTNDPAHSRLGFVTKHLTVAEIDGYFGDFKTVVTVLSEDNSNFEVELTAQIASINTGIEMRDNHLRSADFFDAEKYPTLTFKSTSVKVVDDKNAVLYGELTLHGVTKPVELNVTYFGTVANPMNNIETAGFQIKGSIKRSDFNVGSQFPEMVVGDEVKILANVEFNPVTE